MEKPKKLFEPYRRFPVAERYDAVVIGSGMGGLTTAALLARYAGKRVLVLERHYTVGGYTHVFHRPGYEWDVGVHYIGDMRPRSALRSMFDVLTEGRLEWADMGEVYDEIIIGGETYRLPRGEKRLKAYLKERFPGEEAAIDAYFATVKKALATSLPYHADKVIPPVLSRLIGPLLRRKFLKYSDRTTREVVESFTKNQKLIAVLTSRFGDYGLPPAESSFIIDAMVTNHYLGGGWYPVGGSGRIAEAIIPAIQEKGGAVLINAEVAEIVVEKGRTKGVRMADDRIIEAPIVVSNAGVFNTFEHLLSSHASKATGMPAKMKALRPSAAHLSLYVGLKESAGELGLPKANKWVYPDEFPEKNLAAMRESIDADFPLVYISFPSAKDPDFDSRHPGRATIELVTFAPWSAFAKWDGTRWKKRGEDYDALKERLATRLLDVLYEQVPQVKGKVDYYELSTPLSTKNFTNYQHGEIYGIDHTPQRFRQKYLRPRTAIAGLYLTGQDIVSCGIAGALFGGVLSASAILGKNLIPVIVKSAQEQARSRVKGKDVEASTQAVQG